MLGTGIVRDERYLDHRTGPYHPENPKRLEAIYEMLEDSDITGRFIEVPVRPAEREELLWIHSPEYVNRVASTEGRDCVRLDADTSTSPGSYQAALLAAGGLCEALGMVTSGKLDNAFALVRPPGHHAERGGGMGFCLFNNVAVAARYARESQGIQRILIVDWDLHHGNGTQHSLEHDPSILYFSTHQYPFYPGTGSFREAGKGKGEGFTVNVPLSGGYGDGEYLSIFEKILRPIALEFMPELVLVSAGFDIHEYDPLGRMHVTADGFAALTRSVMDIAGECCGGRLVMTLEGGYNLMALRDSVKAVLRELCALTLTHKQEIMSHADIYKVNDTVENVWEVHSRFWKNLKP
jgi:acetoin utilization deacetylase AcuC-like enzyme